MAQLWVVKPVLPQACTESSGFPLFLIVPCSPREHTPFAKVTDSLIPNFGRLRIEVLGTPAYFKLPPDKYLLCAYGLYVEILRTVS